MRQHLQGELIQNRYQIESVLGQGGNAIVYKAHDLDGDCPVALKAMSLRYLKGWKQLELFEREAEILKKLNHPRIPRYLEYFTVDLPDDQLFYLVQELADGKSFAELVESGWRTNESGIKEIASQVLEILEYLHSQKPPVLHRDIKPQNLILGKDYQIYLIDFGAVQDIDQTASASSNTVVGTFGYMAPEQYMGQCVPATDLYALGATLIYLLTHRPPTEIVTENLRLNFQHHIQISKSFTIWLEKILDPELEKRFTSAHKAQRELTQKIFIFQKTSTAKTWQRFFAFGVAICASVGIGNYFKYPIFNFFELTPKYIFIAANQGDLQVIKNYLEKGGDPNGRGSHITFDQEMGYVQSLTLLHAANTPEVAQLLIDKGGNVNAKTKEGFTPLHLTSSPEVAQILIDHGADLNSQADVVNTFSEGRLAEPALMSAVAYPNDWFMRFGTPLHFNDSIDVLKVLIRNNADVNMPNFTGHTPLHLAALLCDKEKVKLLLDQDVDINQRYKARRQGHYEATPLHLAALCGQYYREGKIETIKLLLEKGADTSQKNSLGETALHNAVGVSQDGEKFNISQEILNILLDYGSDINAINNQGQSVLFEANNVETARFLIEHGAIANHIDKNGNNLIHKNVLNKRSLLENQELIKFFVMRGVDIDLKNHKGQTPILLTGNDEIASVLIELGANLDVADNNGDTLLHYAALYMWECSIFTLVKHIDINSENHSGHTALDISYQSRNNYSNYSEQIIDLLKGKEIEETQVKACEK